MKAFFTIEAIFALVLIPFMLYFVASQNSTDPQEKLLQLHQLDLLNDILDSLERGDSLNEAGVADAIAQVESQTSYRLCYQYLETDTCTKPSLCAWRTILEDDYTRLYLCMEAQE